MIALSLQTIAEICQGTLIGQDSQIEQLSTDSRQLQQGDLFVALKGPNFDGHKFVTTAIDHDCCAILVESPQAVDVPQVIVQDTRIALGKMGAYVKQQAQVKTIAITGSSGKTTVKEMIAAIMSRLGKVLATQGNFNNDIGVPLTLLRLTPEYDYAVIELGANHTGEIAYTVDLVKPDIALINNVAPAHLEGFGDLVGVARAKGEIFSGLSTEGIAIFNQDIQFKEQWLWRLTDCNVQHFSCTNQSEYFAEHIQLDDDGFASFKLNTPQGSCYIELPIPGRHNVCNAVAAACAAIALGASLDDVQLGLAQMQPVKGRMNLYQVTPQLRLLDDSYNANVESMKAAIELLASYAGCRILVLGDMGELGSEARNYHQQIGEFAAEQGIDKLFSLGVLSQSSADAFGVNAEHFSSRQTLVEQLIAFVQTQQQQVTVLVKGSRSARMELVVADVKQLLAGTTEC